ncbi:MAG: hypothetical protein M1818_001117 [Claussenomyces sp. TS43310]|nr:MAG: hypothetical protein M1818_001117 [Claussenomyces sp. TS43310]
MLAFLPEKKHVPECVPNILPCRINHNGRVNSAKRYWAPVAAKNSRSVSYFRGRKLYGRTGRLPSGYVGVVLTPTRKKLCQEKQQVSIKQNYREDDEEFGVAVVDKNATFEDFVIWGYRVLLDNVTDPYAQGTEEWIGIAEQIHTYGSKIARNKMS